MNKNANDIYGFSLSHAIYPKGDCYAREKNV